MEGGVEDGDLLDAGEHSYGLVDAGEVGRIVKRGELGVLLYRRDDFGVDYHRLGVALASVDDAMAYGPYFAQVLDEAESRVRQGLLDEGEGRPMVGNGELPGDFPLGSALGKSAQGLADPLDDALSHA
jgi:hypothetical protein